MTEKQERERTKTVLSQFKGGGAQLQVKFGRDR